MKIATPAELVSYCVTTKTVAKNVRHSAPNARKCATTVRACARTAENATIAFPMTVGATVATPAAYVPMSARTATDALSAPISAPIAAIPAATVRNSVRYADVATPVRARTVGATAAAYAVPASLSAKTVTPAICVQTFAPIAEISATTVLNFVATAINAMIAYRLKAGATTAAYAVLA